MLRQLSLLSCLIGLTVLLSQCQTLTLDMRKSGTLPMVEIEGVSFAEIADACGEVLAQHDFRSAGARGPRRIYERPASTVEFLAWGGFYADDETVVRLNIYIRELGIDSFEVEGQPYIVTSAGGHMEEARKVSRLKSKKYQKIMNQIKEQALGGRPGVDPDYADDLWEY